MKTIRGKLIVAIALPLTLIYLGIIFMEYRFGRDEAIADTTARLTDRAETFAAIIDGRMGTVAQQTLTAAELIAADPRNADRATEILRATITTNRDVYGMCIAYEPVETPKGGRKFFAPYYCRDLSGKGSLRYVDIADVEPDYTILDWYLLAKLLNKPAWSDPYFDQGVGNILMVTFSVPVMREGKLIAVVTADISLDYLRERMATRTLEGGYLFLISQTGTFISHPEEDYILDHSIFSLAEEYDNAALDAAGRRMIAGQSGAVNVPDVKTGKNKLMVFSPVKSALWSLAAMVPEENVLAPVHARISRDVGTLFAGLAAIIIIILAVSIKLSRPVARLSAAARKLADGNLDVHVDDVRGRDEIAQLATTFNKMVGDLKANVEYRIREESARKAVESELKVAREIQASLLPRIFPPFPDRQEFSLHAVNQPAKFMAGDFFDFFFINDETLVVVMADVSGKGVPAAMFMAVARTAIRNFTVPNLSPSKIITQVNDVVTQDNDRNMFVTIFYAHYNVRTGELKYVNAGHNPPYILHVDKTLTELKSTGTMVAAFEDMKFDQASTTLAVGELLLLFTDGVTEANSGGDMYGEERLEKLIVRVGDKKVEDVCQEIIDDASDYSRNPLGQVELKDDVTLLALRRNR